MNNTFVSRLSLEDQWRVVFTDAALRSMDCVVPEWYLDHDFGCLVVRLVQGGAGDRVVRFVSRFPIDAEPESACEEAINEYVKGIPDE